MDALLKTIHTSKFPMFIRCAIKAQAKRVPGLSKLRLKKINGACNYRLRYLRRGGIYN